MGRLARAFAVGMAALVLSGCDNPPSVAVENSSAPQVGSLKVEYISGSKILPQDMSEIFVLTSTGDRVRCITVNTFTYGSTTNAFGISCDWDNAERAGKARP